MTTAATPVKKASRLAWMDIAKGLGIFGAGIERAVNAALERWVFKKGNPSVSREAQRVA